MFDDASLEGLQGLHRDLLCLAEVTVPNVDRLDGELRARIQEFRALLDKPSKNDKSRHTVISGTVSIDGTDYSLNDEFKQEVIQVADALDLDEVEAAKLLLLAQADSQELDRTLVASAIIRFHKGRQFLLECLRVIATVATDEDAYEQSGGLLRDYLRGVLEVSDGQIDNGPRFWKKCFSKLAEIETWLQKIAEQLQSASVLGQANSESVEIIEFERSSLTRQHESLSAICALLVKGGYTNADCLHSLLGKLKSFDKHDLILVHYLPMVMSLLAHVAAESGSLDQARNMHQIIVKAKSNDNWAFRNLHAAVVVWWLAEYSGRYVDNHPIRGVDLEAEAEERSKLFMEALRDGAFHFMLSVSQDIKPDQWYDPAKAGLLGFLLQEATVLPQETVPVSDYFQVIFQEQLQSFVDAFITNMPDTLRELKHEEDGQRRLLSSRFPRGPQDYEAHLERFLVIIAYAFDGSPEAAQMFWADTEGNLFGFLQWAAKRQPTPRVAAFCEMLRAISAGEECAEAAHKFLIEESTSASGKLRRSVSLSYSQIFNELQFYAQTVRDKQSSNLPTAFGPPQTVEQVIVEPESGMMLECYLRLLSHIFAQSSTAREWVLSNTSTNLVNLLFGLCSTAGETRLRASAFSVLTSLLTDKTTQLSESMWVAVDGWVASALSNTMILGKPPLPAVLNREDQLWDALSAGFEESCALVDLLKALLIPSVDSSPLYDYLPFPENLGSSSRMPGIDMYTDFVLGRVFANRSPNLPDPLKQTILRLKCLEYVSFCLQTFNQDLVMFANQSNVAVDAVIQSSDLATYVRLHPFGRVMEWLFNDKVLANLFDTASQNPAEINDALPESPLMLSVLKAIEVMDHLMTLQATYLDIVRPLLKQERSSGRPGVSNNALASFEDAVLNRLQLLVNLGLYCGTGHQELTIVSLQLLEKLASSRKLVVSPVAGFGQRSDRSRIISVLEKDNESERIARSLMSELKFDEREFEGGHLTPGFAIKLRILDFLLSCLSSLPNRPTVAHLLLGFNCHATTVDIAEDSLFASGSSLFHSVLELAVDYPAFEFPGNFASWALTIKRKASEVIRRLLVSPLTSLHILPELRANDFAIVLASHQVKIGLETLWDGRTIDDPKFYTSNSAVAFENFLFQRSLFYDYVARELRMTVQGGMASLRERIQSTLLGLTLLPDGEQIPHLSIFDLVDFLEYDLPEPFGLPTTQLFSEIDLMACKSEQGTMTSYDLGNAEQLLTLRMNELRQTNAITSTDEPQCEAEMKAVLAHILADNHIHRIASTRTDVLRSWTQLMKVILESCDFEADVKMSFILQALQVIIPKWERACATDVVAATELSSLAGVLLKNVDFGSSSFDADRTGDFANDRLSQLFRIALNSIFSPLSTAELRELCYQICYRYLRETSQYLKKGSALSRFIFKLVKAPGDRLIDLVCDDAYSGVGTCRISAVLFLEALVSCAMREESKYIIESLVRVNFIGLLIEGVRQISTELGATPAPDVPLLLAYYDATFALLQRICQTRFGAAHVLNAGLFQAINDSQIFAADPDIGLDFETPQALQKYFELMLSILRVINAAVLSRGPQNDHTVQLAREFLRSNRGSMVAVFKRNANVGGLRADDGEDMIEILDTLVDNFTLLVSATDFLEYENKTTLRRSAGFSFS